MGTSLTVGLTVRTGDGGIAAGPCGAREQALLTAETSMIAAINPVFFIVIMCA
jgi:hypothetical protein